MRTFSLLDAAAIVLRSGTEEFWIASPNALNLSLLPPLRSNVTRQWPRHPHVAKQAERIPHGSEAEIQRNGTGGVAGDIVSEHTEPLRERIRIDSPSGDAPNRRSRAGQDHPQSASLDRLTDHGELKRSGRRHTSLVRHELGLKRKSTFQPPYCLMGIISAVVECPVGRT
jgi:hypothetical protein